MPQRRWPRCTSCSSRSPGVAGIPGINRTGLTVLLVEQNVRSALSIADHGVVISLGRIVADADAAELRDDSELRHAYLGF